MFRFTIRDLLKLMVVAALVISWIHERYALVRMRQRSMKRSMNASTYASNSLLRFARLNFKSGQPASVHRGGSICWAGKMMDGSRSPLLSIGLCHEHLPSPVR